MVVWQAANLCTHGADDSISPPRTPLSSSRAELSGANQSTQSPLSGTNIRLKVSPIFAPPSREAGVGTLAAAGVAERGRAERRHTHTAYNSVRPYPRSVGGPLAGAVKLFIRRASTVMAHEKFTARWPSRDEDAMSRRGRPALRCCAAALLIQGERDQHQRAR